MGSTGLHTFSLRSVVMSMSLLLIMSSTARAHEDHSHPLTDIPLWQIAVIVGLAFAVFIWFRRR